MPPDNFQEGSLSFGMLFLLVLMVLIASAACSFLLLKKFTKNK